MFAYKPLLTIPKLCIRIWTSWVYICVWLLCRCKVRDPRHKHTFFYQVHCKRGSISLCNYLDRYTHDIVYIESGVYRYLYIEYSKIYLMWPRDVGLMVKAITIINQLVECVIRYNSIVLLSIVERLRQFNCYYWLFSSEEFLIFF